MGAAIVIVALLSAPLAALVSSLAVPRAEIWRHLWRTQLLELLANTTLLLAAVGAGTLVAGAGLAWLVVHHRFPGRSAFEWALILPMAMPAYVVGFAFLGLFDYAGPLQTAARGWLGAAVWVPELPSGAGVAAVMTLAFYPYVYLFARAAFCERGTSAFETARTLGCSGLAIFLRVALPLARPALAAGVALAMMEALADFGTVATFGYRTLTEAIYRVWYGMFDRIAATQLASVLLFFVLGLILLERALRGRARFASSGRRASAPAPSHLRGWRAGAATALCATVVSLAFLLPAGQLAWWAWAALGSGRIAPAFGALLARSCALAALASCLACGLALLLAYAGRLHRSSTVRLAAQLAAMGYAVPGAVIAVGVLLPLAWIDHTLVPLMERHLAWPVGAGLTGSLFGLVFAYVVRYLAVGLHPIEGSLGRIAPQLDDAARSLGSRAGARLRRIHLPLMRGSLATAAILVFVETLKEMPATLLLRPLGMNTLTVEIWERTSEAMWEEAAVPALALVGAGLAPVMLLMRLGARAVDSAPDGRGPSAERRKRRRVRIVDTGSHA